MQADARVTGYVATTIVAVELAVALAKKTYIRNNPYERKAFIDSRGRWEGNTLVVDVTNLTDKTWVVGELGGEGMSAGSFHSPALHVVERFTIVGDGRIDYEATIEDPNVFERPWKIAFPVWQRAPADYVLFEYACHEGNRSMDLSAPLIGDSSGQ